MGLSGAILSARKVSPAIRAKTGAATRLPKCWPARGSSMEIATIMRGAVFEVRHRQRWPIARKHGGGAGNLKERDGNAIALGHRGLFNAPPAFPRAQPASDRARKMNMRRLAEADAAEHVPHFLRFEH